MINPLSVKIELTKKQREHIARLKSENFFRFAPPDSCFACGGSHFTMVAEHDRYGFTLDYLACLKCGFLFANPYYTDQCLEEFYKSHYAHIYGRSGSERLVFEGGYLNAIDVILPLVGKFMPRCGAVMDFGCGYGGSLVAFPKDWHRVGYDYDDEQLNYGRRLGLDLRDIQDFDTSKETFDVIMLNQVLEHVRDPIRLLEILQSRLKQNGVIYVEVPGFASVLERGIDPRLAFKNAHRHFFCLGSLSMVAARAGLKLLVGNERVSAVFQKHAQDKSDIGITEGVEPAFSWLDRLKNGRTTVYAITDPLWVRLQIKVYRWIRLQKLRRDLASRV